MERPVPPAQEGPLVRLEVTGPIATLTLDSPHNRNALSAALVAQLGERLAAVAGRESVRVVLLRAAGPAFCSGADLAEARAEGMEAGALRIVALQRAILALPQPVVCRVQGAVRAGGIGLVAAADIALGASDATFALTEVRLGLAAAVVSLTVHARMTARSAGLATLGGEVFDGRQAADWGLLTRAVPADALDAEVDRVCAALASGHPQGLRESKRLLNADLLARVDERGASMAALSARLFASDAAREAMAGFLARRTR